DPEMGKLVYPVSLNGYLYADGAPVDQLDPRGEGQFPGAKADPWNWDRGLELATWVLNSIMGVIGAYLLATSNRNTLERAATGFLLGYLSLTGFYFLGTGQWLPALALVSMGFVTLFLYVALIPDPPKHPLMDD